MCTECIYVLSVRAWGASAFDMPTRAHQVHAHGMYMHGMHLHGLYTCAFECEMARASAFHALVPIHVHARAIRSLNASTRRWKVSKSKSAISDVKQ